jgi:hypothetical protein
MCHCTNKLPHDDNILVKPHQVRNVTMGVLANPCHISCPGAVFALVCKADECCGGGDDGTPTYTVHSVGGVDPVKTILHRMAKSLRNNQFSWMRRYGLEYNQCLDDYSAIGEYGYVTYKNSGRTIGHKYLNQYGRPNSVQCRDYCSGRSECRAIEYYPDNRKCILFDRFHFEMEPEYSPNITKVEDRKCNSTIKITPSSFQLDVLNHQTLIQYEPATSREPLGTYDFELDLTKSNYWDTVKRSVEVNAGEDMTFTTDVGFDVRDTDMSSTSQETTEGTTTSTTDSMDWSQTRSHSYTVGASVTAEASVNVFGFTASVSATAGFRDTSESSTTISGSKSNTDSQSFTETEGNTESQERGRARSYNRGYSKVVKSDKKSIYEFGLTVPAFHRGTLTFMKEKRKTILKYRTDYQLNGYVKLVISNPDHRHSYEKEVHVSRILFGNERILSTLGSVVYDRAVIVAKTSVYDRKGNLITSNSQVGENVDKGRNSKS